MFSTCYLYLGRFTGHPQQNNEAGGSKCLTVPLPSQWRSAVWILESVPCHSFICTSYVCLFEGVTKQLFKHVGSYVRLQKTKNTMLFALNIFRRVCVHAWIHYIWVRLNASFRPHFLRELLFRTSAPDTDVSLESREPLTHTLRTDMVLLLPNTEVLREEHCIMQPLWNYCRKMPAENWSCWSYKAWVNLKHINKSSCSSVGRAWHIAKDIWTNRHTLTAYL